MRYSEFEINLLEELKDFYGKDAIVYIVQDSPDKAQKGDGIYIQFTGDDTAPAISLNKLYEYYLNGSLSMVDCIGWVIDKRENL